MTEQRKRGRPKKDPNAPKSNYYYSFAVKARKQSQKRLRDAEKRAAKATKQAEDKRHYAKKLKEKITKVDKAINNNETTLIDQTDLQGLPNDKTILVNSHFPEIKNNNVNSKTIPELYTYFNNSNSFNKVKYIRNFKYGHSMSNLTTN